MLDALFTAAAIAAMYFAFALLAFTQERHYSGTTRGMDFPHPSAVALRRRRCLAGIGLAAGYGLCVSGNGASFGSILWIVLLGACAMAVAFTLAWKPHWLKIIVKQTVR